MPLVNFPKYLLWPGEVSICAFVVEKFLHNSESVTVTQRFFPRLFPKLSPFNIGRKNIMSVGFQLSTKIVGFKQEKF